MIYTHNLEPSFMNPEWTGYCEPTKYAGKDTHSYYIWNMHPGKSWALNLWKFNCIDEGLLNGTNKCLDAHFYNLTHKEASYNSEMFATWSTDKNFFGGKEPTTTLIATQEDAICPLGTYYSDSTLGSEYQWWLCPNWAYMHGGEPPEETHLWLSLTKTF